ncbi:hypothetical protein [Stenotrophomonas sp. S41]|uniref:hypothetical protein n=1 Tax=Stenotrophomonas sp. S41 TaxID=2767464 RepID=UPI00190DDB33|nr:hypothetical protein [Stenotrophomonas sp. S41]MBK0011100.1 hypothetical protein [Stenotrophomonas sp. S41]
MNTSMADGASERLDAQIANALFGQPGMSKLDVANRLRELRGTGAPLLADVGNPVSVSLAGQGNALAEAARRVISDIDSGDYHGEISEATYAALQAALAAHQPVDAAVKDSLTVAGGQAVGQEPVAPKKMARAVALDLMHAVYEHHGWKRAEGESMTARVHGLYDLVLDAGRNRFVATPKPDAPPAQDVDLRPLSDLVAEWSHLADQMQGVLPQGSHTLRGYADQLKGRIALIDSKAAGNG